MAKIIDGQESSQKLQRLIRRRSGTLTKALAQTWQRIKSEVPETMSAMTQQLEAAIRSEIQGVWNDAFVPEYVGAAISSARLVEFGTKPTAKVIDRRWKEVELAWKMVCGKALESQSGDETLVTADLAGVAAGWPWPSYQPMEEWIANRAGAMIRHITSNQLEAVRRELERVIFVEQLSVEVAARRVREIVGLLPKHVEQLWRLREDLVAAGWSEDQIELQIRRAAKRKLNSRGRTIARTELAESWHSAQERAIQSAIDAGDLDEGLTKTWWAVMDERTGELDASLHGKTVAYNEPFTDGLMHPPTRPNCRCSLTFETEI